MGVLSLPLLWVHIPGRVPDGLLLGWLTKTAGIKKACVCMISSANLVCDRWMQEWLVDQIPCLGTAVSFPAPWGCCSVYLQLQPHWIYLLHPQNPDQEVLVIMDAPSAIGPH